MNRAILLVLPALACGGTTDTKSTHDGTLPATGDSATPHDSATDSGSPPTPACPSRGTTVGALTDQGCLSEAACAWAGTYAYEYLGYSASGGADFDGDGTEDIAIGGIFADTVIDGAAVYDVGQALLLSGADLAAGGTGSPRSFFGLTESEQAGSSLSFTGDLDADDDSELLVGARNYSPLGVPSTGAVHLILGGTDRTPTLHRTWTGSQTYGRSGHAVLGTGDLDGDGFHELAVGGNLWEAVGAEATEVFSHGTVFIASGAAPPDSGPLSSFPVQLDGATATEQAGSALASGDLNADGYADLVIGAPYGATTRGAVYVVLGSASSLTPTTASLADTAAVTLEGTAIGDAFGWSVAVGEVTGDDHLDIIVGAPLHDAPWGAEGELTVFSGVARDAPTIVARRTGEADDHQLGTGITAGRDLDGDGTGDVVVGAVAAWHELRPKSGRAYILSGGASLTGDHTIGGRQLHALGTKDFLGRAAAMSDIDADGTADLVVSTAYANPDGSTDAGGVWLFFGG